MKLTKKQADIMRLIRRSTLVDGWCRVSPPVWPVVADAHMPAELLEVREIDGVHSVRVTHDGEVVMKYLI